MTLLPTRLIKRFLIFLLILACVAGAWLAFALWSGIYSVYSIPPSKEDPRGKTLLVSREQWEPMFNSPQAGQASSQGNDGGTGYSFESSRKLRKPLSQRTILELPFFEWAYKKSLETSPTSTHH